MHTSTSAIFDKRASSLLIPIAVSMALATTHGDRHPTSSYWAKASPSPGAYRSQLLVRQMTDLPSAAGILAARIFAARDGGNIEGVSVRKDGIGI